MIVLWDTSGRLGKIFANIYIYIYIYMYINREVIPNRTPCVSTGWKSPLWFDKYEARWKRSYSPPVVISYIQHAVLNWHYILLPRMAPAILQYASIYLFFWSEKYSIAGILWVRHRYISGSKTTYAYPRSSILNVITLQTLALNRF